MKHLSPIVFSAAALALIFGTAHAQDAETTIKARQSHMRLTSCNLGPLEVMARGDLPYDAAVASGAAGNLAVLGTLQSLPRRTKAGSGPRPPVSRKTRARAR